MKKCFCMKFKVFAPFGERIEMIVKCDQLQFEFKPTKDFEKKN